MLRIIGQLALSLALLAAVPATAQNLFAPVAKVDGAVVTAYEQQQRARMLTLFRSPGDPMETALDTLIDERLQVREAVRQGLSVTEDEIVAGEEEFAQRANLDREKFLAAIAQQGVARQSLRDFVTAGLLWRKVVRQEFGRKVEITPAEVARAKAKATSEGSGLRVLLSEIILPAPNEAARQAALSRAEDLGSITSLDAFSAAARRYSAAPTARVGGRIDWMPVSNLPPNIASLVVALAPGQVTPPVPLPNAVAVFQLRALDEGATQARAGAIEYAVFTLPGSDAAAQAQAAQIARGLDTCDDLYGAAKGLPEDRLLRETKAPGQIPGDVALELAKLDAGEVATTLLGGNRLALVMLCHRIADPSLETTDDQIRERLLNQRLAGLAENYLAELRANAHVERAAAARAGQ